MHIRGGEHNANNNNENREIRPQKYQAAYTHRITAAPSTKKGASEFHNPIHLSPHPNNRQMNCYEYFESIHKTFKSEKEIILYTYTTLSCVEKTTCLCNPNKPHDFSFFSILLEKIMLYGMPHTRTLSLKRVINVYSISNIDDGESAEQHGEG